MYSFRVCQCGAPLRRMEEPTPKPVGAEVLLKIKAAGVCHTDLHLWDGYYDLGSGRKLYMAERGVTLPLTMGHENVGEVVAAGPDAPNVSVGRMMLAYPWIGCGHCMVCEQGAENLCLKPRSLGVFTSGGYADYMLVPHPRYLFDIGDLPPERAAPLACSGITAYSALKKLGDAVQKQPVVMIGAGGVGLTCLAIHKALGGKAAIFVDIEESKRAAAIEAGAIAAIDGRAADALQQIRSATGGGAWAVIDFVGSTQTVELAVGALTKGGKLVVVGLFGGNVTIPTPHFALRAITLQGSYVGSLDDTRELVALARSGALPSAPVTTRSLSNVNEALSDLKSGAVVGRIVLTP
ncbi:MAG: alcohol dehydrogenase catalytic domain-containing protein [Proteobacteria bacterium]|nr:alcohol dehydrogenase catalytic domain-containing protein [Pseudomonadota bacterium]